MSEENEEKIEDNKTKEIRRTELMRIHKNLANSIKQIRKKRKEFGLKDISYVEITKLMTKHKNYEKNIEMDIANYSGYEDE